MPLSETDSPRRRPLPRPWLVADSPEFRAKVLVAFGLLLRSSDCESLLGRFKQAFDHRRKLPWLGESGLPGNIGDGLAFAVGQAVSMDGAPSAHVPRPVSLCLPDSTFRREFEEAATRAVTDPEAMRRLAQAIDFDGRHVEHVSAAALASRIGEGLVAYAEHADEGTAGEA